MKPKAPPVLPAVMMMPDQISFDCPACEVTHMLMRGLDYEEGPDGVWRTKERPGMECDCSVLLDADFTLTPVARTPATPSIRMRCDAGPPVGSSKARR